MLAHSHWPSRRARLGGPAPDPTGGAYDPEACAEMLHALVRPATQLDPTQAAAAAALVAKLASLPGDLPHPWRRALDGLHDHARFFDVLRAPPELAAPMAALRSAAATSESPVRAAQAMLGIARTLAGAASVNTLAATAERAGALPIGVSTLPLSGAHVVPLAELPITAAHVARKLAENLLGWQGEVARERATWAAERAEAAHRVRADGAVEFDALVHARSEVNQLAAIVEAVSRQDGHEVAPVLALDRALSDVARLVAEHALPRWLAVPEVAIPLLAFVGGSRTSRPFIPGLVAAALRRDDLAPEVVGAVVALGSTKLTGLTREEAWLGTEGVNRVTRGEQEARALDDVEALLEADSGLRRTLWQYGLRRDAVAPARRDALLAVLRGLPSNRVARIGEALAHDQVAQAAALDWVIEAREHGAYEVLEAWPVPTSLRARWYLALASTGDQRAMALLTPRLLAGDDEAEKAALDAGMRLAASQVRLRREVASRVAPLAAAFDLALSEAAREREALGRATAAGADLANERLRATARRSLMEIKLVEASVEAATFSVRLEPVLVLAERLTRRLDDERQRLAAAADALALCQRRLGQQESAARACQAGMDRTREEIRSLEQDRRRAASQLALAEQKVSRARRDLAERAAEVDRAEAAVRSARGEGASNRAHASARGARARSEGARDALTAAERHAEGARAEALALEQALGAAHGRLGALEAQASRHDAAVRSLQVQLREAIAHADRCQRTMEATERELQAAKHRVTTLAGEARKAAAARELELHAERGALDRVLAAAAEAEGRESTAAREAQEARARRTAAQQEVNALEQLDQAASAQLEANVAPAAEEQARLDVSRRARSEEARRRAHAVQALAVSADVLYCLWHALDGVASPIKPYAGRLTGNGARP